MAMTEKELLQLKDEIDEAKTKVAELKGQQQMLMNQLLETYGCKTIADAEKKLKLMDKEISTVQNQIDEGIKELEEKYK